MPTTYSPEQIQKILEKLPEELKEAIFSVETASAIRETCMKHNVIDKRSALIAEFAGYVLMGLLLPQEFSEKLEKEAGLSKEVAEEVTRDLNRLVFYPVKPALEQLHQMEIQVSAKIVTPQPEAEEQTQGQKPEEGPRKEDKYRESI